MILKELYLYPDLKYYPDSIVHPFRDQSRSVCNFLEREIKAIKFDANGFKRICVVGSSSPREECIINSSKILVVEVQFDSTEYSGLDEANLNAYFSKMLHSGFEKCSRQFVIPLLDLKLGLEKFIAEGGVNEWTFKSKQFKGIGLKCSLVCKLTTTSFHLVLVVSKSGVEILRTEILKTDPDELVFSPMFKDILLDGGSLVVVDKLGDPLFFKKVKDFEND